MDLFEADANADETFCMACIGIGTLVKGANVILLGEVVDKELRDEAHHAFIGSCGGVRFNGSCHSLTSLLSSEG